MLLRSQSKKRKIKSRKNKINGEIKSIKNDWGEQD